uniref:Uncharacterized protein n=1 Tax=Opuntia streptacantha TaxID=393608 RepID=A0A7C8Z3T8_OPUST
MLEHSGLGLEQLEKEAKLENRLASWLVESRRQLLWEGRLRFRMISGPDPVQEIRPASPAHLKPYGCCCSHILLYYCIFSHFSIAEEEESILMHSHDNDFGKALHLHDARFAPGKNDHHKPHEECEREAMKVLLQTQHLHLHEPFLCPE